MPKDFTHRFSHPLSDLLAKEYHQNHLHNTANTADLLAGGSSSLTSKHSQQRTTSQPSPHVKLQGQQHPFNLRYPSPSAFFHHQSLKSSSTRHTPSPHQTATSTQSERRSSDILLEELKRKSEASREDEEAEESNKERETTGNLYKESSLEHLLQRRRTSDGMRAYTQLLLSNTPSCTDTSSCKEKSSSSSTSSTPPPTSALLAQHQHLSQMLKSPSAESSAGSLFSEPPIEEETRCVVCNAHFPNVWLLEQHAALQHPLLGPGEEKPFICEQCGQSYRYRSAYAKHKEQNHRARLPADKLFTCDVCGMQFRYLKSFKKHRLNHALERLHGKKGGAKQLGGISSSSGTAGPMDQDVVTSSQETMPAEESGEDLRINIKREQKQETEESEELAREEEQDNTIDSVGQMLYNDNNSSSASASTAEPNISSSNVIHSTNKRVSL